MKFIHACVIVPVALVAFACKGNDADKVDAALNNDLSTAAQVQPYNKLDSISAAERAAQAQRQAAAPRRTHYSSGSSGASARREPTYHTEKHGGRDAAIGAGAGAILGAATSKNKVKGAIIGGAAGGILGAVIGNNVDKKKVPNN